MRDLNVLVFSAAFGAGHIRAAEAIIEAIRQKEPSAKITHVDFGEFLNPGFNWVVKNMYIEMIKYAPKVWGNFYYRTEDIGPDSFFQRFLNRLGLKEYLRYIRSVQPDVIICTYPTIAGVLARAKSMNLLQVPLVTVITDYSVHSQWIHHGVDLYIVGNQDVQEGLVSRGIDPRCIRVTGIPVSSRFEHIVDRKEVAERMGLSHDCTTFLIMAGAYGVLNGVKRICRMLADTPAPVQTIVVCGKNRKLFRSLGDIVNKAKNPVIRYGYVRNMEEMMSVSDIIITKAGGLTVSEALTKRLPLLIYRPIPGQEERNSDYVERTGTGRIARTERELEQLLDYYICRPGEMTEMAKAAARTNQGRAAERAAEYILELVETIQVKQKVG